MQILRATFETIEQERLGSEAEDIFRIGEELLGGGVLLCTGVEFIRYEVHSFMGGRSQARGAVSSTHFTLAMNRTLIFQNCLVSRY